MKITFENAGTSGSPITVDVEDGTDVQTFLIDNGVDVRFSKAFVDGVPAEQRNQLKEGNEVAVVPSNMKSA